MSTTVKMKPARVFLRMEEVAEMLGLSRASVYSLIYRGELLRVKIGRAARIPASSVQEFVSRTQGQRE